MPLTRVLLFTEHDDSPFLRWLDSLPARPRMKCIVRIERLEQLGTDLTLPESVFIENELLALPVVADGLKYAILYFFHGSIAVILHGCTSQTGVATADIALALDRRVRFCGRPDFHTYQEDEYHVPVED